MNTLLSARGRAHTPVRAAVVAACLAVVACFGLAVGFESAPLEAAQPQAEVATR